MIQALVNDCNSHLSSMEISRQTLEGAVAQGENDDELRAKSAELAKHLADCSKALQKALCPPKAAKEQGCSSRGGNILSCLVLTVGTLFLELREPWPAMAKLRNFNQC